LFSIKGGDRNNPPFFKLENVGLFDIGFWLDKQQIALGGVIMKTLVAMLGMIFIILFASLVFADSNGRGHYDGYGNPYDQRSTPDGGYNNQQQPQRYNYDTFGPDSSYGQRRDGTVHPEDLVPRHSPDYYRLKQRRHNYGY